VTDWSGVLAGERSGILAGDLSGVIYDWCLSKL